MFKVGIEAISDGSGGSAVSGFACEVRWRFGEAGLPERSEVRYGGSWDLTYPPDLSLAGTALSTHERPPRTGQHTDGQGLGPPQPENPDTRLLSLFMRGRRVSARGPGDDREPIEDRRDAVGRADDEDRNDEYDHDRDG